MNGRGVVVEYATCCIILWPLEEQSCPTGSVLTASLCRPSGLLTACGQKCVIMAAARTLDSFLPAKFKHRKQHYFNESAYLTFQNFFINPFCTITERNRRGMDA